MIATPHPSASGPEPDLDGHGAGMAQPAFIGYTRRAGTHDPMSLILRPTWIDCAADFLDAFDRDRDLAMEDARDEEELLAHGGDAGHAPHYLLAAAVRGHFRAGRGICCVVSVGLCQSPPVIGLTGDGGLNAASRYGLRDGLAAVASQQGPTVLVVPEAVYLSPPDYAALVSEMLNQHAQCPQRWAIFDLRDPPV